MDKDSNSIYGFLPHLVVLTTLLVLEYWIFTTQATMLVSAGDYGPVVAIQVILAVVVIIIAILGLFFVCGNNPKYEKIVSISLILFIIHIVALFLEYIIFAIE